MLCTGDKVLGMFIKSTTYALVLDFFFGVTNEFPLFTRYQIMACYTGNKLLEICYFNMQQFRFLISSVYYFALQKYEGRIAHFVKGENR